MEDWQEMALITIFVLVAMIAFFVYLGIQMMSIKDSVTELVNMQQALGGQSPSPVSPFFGILGGFRG